MASNGASALSRRPATRSSGPKASGSTSRIGTMPSDTVSMSMSAPPCSHSSCRQRPHGISG